MLSVTLRASASAKLSKREQTHLSTPTSTRVSLLMSKSTLSSVVSTLVRASVGTSVPSTVSDKDLDKHVADLILKEAKQKAESYSKLGIKAYLPARYAVVQTFRRVNDLVTFLQPRPKCTPSQQAFPFIHHSEHR